METHKEEWETKLVAFYIDGEEWIRKSDHLSLLTHQKQTIMDMCDEGINKWTRFDSMKEIYRAGYNQALSDLKEKISKLWSAKSAT